jgi:hypothetical protein
MPQSQLGHRIRNPERLVRLQTERLAGAHIAEAARPGTGVAHDHHGGVPLRPALADIGASGFLADRYQAVVSNKRLGLMINWMGRRLDPDPRRLPLDRIIRPMRLFRMANLDPGAMIDGNAGCGHDSRDVDGGRQPVKQCGGRISNVGEASSLSQPGPSQELLRECALRNNIGWTNPGAVTHNRLGGIEP